jgi:adenine-specific DNA-methyltransferase
MPTLHWIGKDKIINHHQEVPYKVLDHEYGFSENEKTTTTTDSGNLIINGDNLEALKSL